MKEKNRNQRKRANIHITSYRFTLIRQQSCNVWARGRCKWNGMEEIEREFVDRVAHSEIHCACCFYYRFLVSCNNHMWNQLKFHAINEPNNEINSPKIVKSQKTWCVGFYLGIHSQIIRKQVWLFSIRLFSFLWICFDGTPNTNCVITLIINSYWSLIEFYDLFIYSSTYLQWDSFYWFCCG